MPAIINSGAAYIAAVNAGEMAVTDFVLAHIEGLDHTQPVNPAETLPAAGNIVHTAPVTQSGYLAPDKVVYSLVMDSGVGDFTFNWLGLRGEDGTLIAVAYLPDTEKTATAGGVQGNNITRNFLLQFSDAQLATGIDVPAETWQVDVSAYLNAMDDRTRLSNLDLYGRSAFFGDGWKIVDNDGTYQLHPGVGYVGGVRIVCSAPIELDIGNTDQPVIIYLDVALQKNLDRVEPEIKVVFQPSVDYIDSAGNPHVIASLGVIYPSEIHDARRVLDTPEGVAKFLQDKIDEKAPRNSPILTGFPESTNPDLDDNSRRIATTAFVKTVINTVIDTAPGALDTLNELAEALNNDPDFAATITNALATKAPLHSPVLTGNPTAPTQGLGSSNNRLATTQFVQAAIDYLTYHQTDDLSTIYNLAQAILNDPFFGQNVYLAIAQRAPVEHTHALSDVGIIAACKKVPKYMTTGGLIARDPDLKVFLDNSSVYKIEGFLTIYCPVSAESVYIQLFESEGASRITNPTATMTYYCNGVGGPSGITNYFDSSLRLISGNNGANILVNFSGVVFTGSSGNPKWNIGWGPKVQSDEPTGVLAGSWISAQKIG